MDTYQLHDFVDAIELTVHLQRELLAIRPAMDPVQAMNIARVRARAMWAAYVSEIDPFSGEDE